MPDSTEAGKLVSPLATLTTLTALFWGWPLLSSLRSRWWGLAAAAFYGLSPHVVGMAHMVMNEPPFTALVVLAILASERAARQRHPAAGAYMLPGFLAMATFYTRTAGISPLVALLLCTCWRHRAAESGRSRLSFDLGRPKGYETGHGSQLLRGLFYLPLVDARAEGTRVSA